MLIQFLRRGFLAADGGQNAGTNKPEEETPPARTFTQDELDGIVKDRLARQQRAHEQAAREAKEAAEARKLEEQQEWQTLANNRADELKRLKPRAEIADGYEKSVKQLMLKATEELPANIQTILNKLPLADQLDWLTENLDSMKRPPVTTAPDTNTNAWSRGNGQAQTLTDEEYLAKKRRQMRL